MHYSKKLILQSNSPDSSAMSRSLKKEKEWENVTDWQRLKTTKFSMEVKVKVTKFHIYVLVYCNGLYLSGLLHSV